jgi:hypothetical protein
MDQILFRAKVSLGCLYGCVAQKKLDLLQLAARRPTQLCDCAATVMRGDPWNSGSRSIRA